MASFFAHLGAAGTGFVVTAKLVIEAGSWVNGVVFP